MNMTTIQTNRDEVKMQGSSLPILRAHGSITLRGVAALNCLCHASVPLSSLSGLSLSFLVSHSE